MIHLVLARVSGHLLIDNKKQPTPIQVKFVKSRVEKKEKFELARGEILEIPKPKKIEKPITGEILSEFNRRAHDNKSSVQKNKYKSAESVLLMRRSRLRNTVKKKTIQKKKSEKKIVVAKKTVKKGELKKKEKTFMVLKGLFKAQANQEKDKNENQNSLFKGFDPEKFVKFDTGDAEDESDTETVSLDTQEFKYATYFSSIKRQIELVWFYPEQAATKGLQGQLLVQFILDRSGKLVDISLVHSSGHKILDSAAFKAVKNASPYNPFPETIQKGKLKIIASFKYKPFYISHR